MFSKRLLSTLSLLKGLLQRLQKGAVRVMIRITVRTFVFRVSGLSVFVCSLFMMCGGLMDR